MNICQNNYNHNYVCTCQKNINTFQNYINSKTGLIFSAKQVNHYFIYKYENYMIVFNNSTNIWGLMMENKIFVESNNVNEIIYHFLIVTNRLAIIPYEQNIENDINELADLLSFSKIN